MSFFFRPQAPPVPLYTEQKNKIKSHHFCLKVLTAMYELQSGNSAYNRGLKSKDIVRYMQEKFELDGDVKTQVHISLQQSLAYGFITKEFGKYRLIGPMAKVIQEPHDSQDRLNEIERVVKIFWSSRKFPSNCVQTKYSTKSTVNVPNAAEVSCSSICNKPPIRTNTQRRKHYRLSRSPSTGTQMSATVTTVQSGTTAITRKTSASTYYQPSEKRRRKTPCYRRKKGRPRKSRKKYASSAATLSHSGDLEDSNEDRERIL